MRKSVLIILFFMIFIPMCSSNQTNNNQLQSDEKLETIEEKGIIIKDGNKIDKKYEDLYDKHNFIVYDYSSFKEIEIQEPTVIIIDAIKKNDIMHNDKKVAPTHDINNDNVFDATHGILVAKFVTKKLKVVGLNVNVLTLTDVQNYYNLIKQKILSGEKIIAIGMSYYFLLFTPNINEDVDVFEWMSQNTGLKITPEKVGEPEVKEKFLNFLKKELNLMYETIIAITEVAKLTRVYLSGGNHSTLFPYFLIAENTIDVGGANRNWKHPTNSFSEHSELDRHDRAVSIIYWLEDGYDIDEDGLTDFKFNEISQTPLKEYPDDLSIAWNKDLFGEAIENHIINIKIINNKLIMNSKEYELFEVLDNWDNFVKKYSNNLFNITQLFAMYDEISHIAEQNSYELNNSIRAILESKQVFEMNIGIKATDEGRLFTSLNDFDVLYTKNHENQIAPTKILSGTSFAIEFAINKDYEEGILIPDGD